ncbi:unnamed protein product [Leptosia nina]|uniref:Serine/threonine-protein phosphatase 6 regulatory subunit 3 n=1 Tax=Leptosia nina TaxID=320188 RepID=A0AAV1J156_9NEOP
MFWSANYMNTRELNFLLKEENVTLTQILEADDILQECKADNKDLIRFLTRPEILAELVTFITEEPPKDVELTSQYRYANIACEVLTSQLSSLSHRLCMDEVQMNRLCDFVSRDPPLNPLLASYFSRTVEMLFIRSPKQDCYLHHIVSLRALDVFKSRKDFLPNLLKHISTSAIADTFKYFIFCLEDPFNKIFMEWLDENQFLENVMRIIYCNYEPEQIEPVHTPRVTENQTDVEKGLNEESEKIVTNHKDCNSHKDSDTCDHGENSNRIRAVASANASELACEIVFWAGEPWPAKTWCAGELANRMRSDLLVRTLLQGCFTSPPHLRDFALVNGCRLLRALSRPNSGEESGKLKSQRREVEVAVAPHLPLLHNALLQDPQSPAPHNNRRVGAARIRIAALIAELALSDVEDVHTAIRSLGTASVLLDMFFSFPENNFLHTQFHLLIVNISKNETHAHHYWEQLIRECDLLTKLMDTFELNEDKKVTPRAGLMGHVVCICRALSEGEAASHAPADVARRWEEFLESRLQPLLFRLDAPLGGEYPSEVKYETGNTENVCADTFELQNLTQVETDRYDDDMWEDSPSDVLDMDEAVHLSLSEQVSPWEQPSEWGGGEASSREAESTTEGEGWAQFGSENNFPPIDPFAVNTPTPWTSNESNEDKDIDQLESQVRNINAKFGDVVELTYNLLSAMSNLAPHDLASIVSDNALNDPPPAFDSAPVPVPVPATDPFGSPVDFNCAPSECTNSEVDTKPSPPDTHAVHDVSSSSDLNQTDASAPDAKNPLIEDVDTEPKKLIEPVVDTSVTPSTVLNESTESRPVAEAEVPSTADGDGDVSDTHAAER